MRRIKQFLVLFLIVLCIISIVSCSNKDDSNGEKDNFEPERILELKEIEINPNGNDVIYLGETFNSEGYDIYFVYRVVGSATGEVEKVKCEHFYYEDYKVNYEKVGSYSITFVCRINSTILRASTQIQILDSVLAQAKIKHVYGINATYTGENVLLGQEDMSRVKPSVELIYTSGEYKNGELVTEVKVLRDKYELDFSKVNVNVVGQYPVVVRYSEEYDVNGEKITSSVETFFLVNVVEGE